MLDNKMEQNPQQPANKKRPYVRKVLLINPKFQISFLLYTCGIATSILLVFFTANQYFFWKFTQKGRALGLPTDHVFFRFIHDQQTMMNWIYLITAFVAFGILIYSGLFLSNKVAGPLYRLKNYLKDYGDGKIDKKLTFRKKDFFLEIPTHVNECFEKVEKRISSNEKDKAS